MPQLVGLSLSFCVSDIIRGIVQEEDVLFIVSPSPAMIDSLSFEEMITRYSLSYWKLFPVEAVELAKRLKDHLKIIPYHHAFYSLVDGHWAKLIKLETPRHATIDRTNS